MEDLKNKKDEEIVKLILKDHNFYSEIITRYEDKLRRYICRISNISNEDVDDLVQDIFLSVYENINSFDLGLSFSSWIYRIAHNKTVNFWKKNDKDLIHVNLDENLFLVESVFFENTVHLDIENLENQRLIKDVLSKMDLKYREVLILKFLEQKDYKEISDILQKPMGSVATLLNRAKKSFKKEFEKIEKNKQKEYDK